MKEIGETFREKREEIGISKEEASADLCISIAQLDNLEDGNANAFKDVFFLKELIKKYAKYLNLDENELVNEYNEFMFNYTSRIPVAEIEKKVSEIKREEEKEASKKISSPYTKITSPEKKKTKTIIYIIIGIVVIAILVTIILLIKQKVDNNNFVGFNLLEGVKFYEFAK
jgi:cytoskeletal protein RodZ